MKLWVLERRGDRPQYDVADGFVVRAATEKEARDIAAMDCGDEGAMTWRNDALSTCEELEAEGVHGVVLRDFNAG